METESKQQGKDGIGFASNGKPQRVPYDLVGEFEPRTLGGGELIEIEMLYGVQHQNHSHCYASDGVHSFHAGRFDSVHLSV